MIKSTRNSCVVDICLLLYVFIAITGSSSKMQRRQSYKYQEIVHVGKVRDILNNFFDFCKEKFFTVNEKFHKYLNLEKYHRPKCG